jgi:sulfur dioxygenase
MPDVRQLFDAESSTYTYLIGDRATGTAVIIDPVREQVERDLQLVSELGWKLIMSIETHVHADHVTGAGLIRERTGAKIAVSRLGGAPGDLLFDDGDEIELGTETILVRSTPGHTNGCTTFVLGDMAFTGDALLIRGCGRTDFQQGDPRQLYRSVWDKILSLPDTTRLYPGHDYKGRTVTTVAEEKVYNPRLRLDVDAFVALMEGLGLPYPKKIDEAVPANLKNGLVTPGGAPDARTGSP